MSLQTGAEPVAYGLGRETIIRRLPPELGAAQAHPSDPTLGRSALPPSALQRVEQPVRRGQRVAVCDLDEEPARGDLLQP